MESNPKTAQIRMGEKALEELDLLSSESKGSTAAERRGAAIYSLILMHTHPESGSESYKAKLEKTVSTLQGTTETLLKVSNEKKALVELCSELKVLLKKANEEIEKNEEVAESRNAVIQRYQKTVENMVDVMRELTN